MPRNKRKLDVKLDIELHESPRKKPKRRFFKQLSHNPNLSVTATRFVTMVQEESADNVRQVLLAHPHLINVPNVRGRTPLMAAIHTHKMRGNEKLIKLLLDHGADPDLKSTHKFGGEKLTPLEIVRHLKTAYPAQTRYQKIETLMMEAAHEIAPVENNTLEVRAFSSEDGKASDQESVVPSTPMSREEVSMHLLELLSTPLLLEEDGDGLSEKTLTHSNPITPGFIELKYDNKILSEAPNNHNPQVSLKASTDYLDSKW